jgi:hypothetical protein
LKSYNPPLSIFEVSSTPINYCIYTTLPKIAKSQFIIH